jgi:A/G-specific adenine glycosylase
VKEEDKILFYQKNSNEWLAGQWELPTFILSTEDEKLKQYPVLKKKIKTDGLKTIKSSITKYKIQNFILEMNAKEFQKLTVDSRFQFKTFNQKLNAGSVMFKILNAHKLSDY